MSELRDPAQSNAGQTAADVPVISPVSSPSSPLVRVGGLLGIVGCLLGLIILIVGCAGYNRGLALSVGAVGLGGLGLVVALVGGLIHHRRIGQDTHILQALFACLMSVVGGLIEMAVWLKWPILK
jgi:hypothetical protein